PIAVVAIKIAAPEVIGYVEVGCPVGIEIAPGAGKTVAIVVHIQPRSRSPVSESRVAFIVQQEVRRPIARVEVRHGIVVLVEAGVVAVQAKIDVEPPVTIVVRDGGVGECSLGELGKPEGVTLKRKFSVSLIHEQQRAAAANYQKV